MESPDPGGPLSDAEVQELTRLLARLASHDLDQWENWRIDTSHGPVFMSISRKLLPGWPEDAFTTIWPMPGHLAKDRPRGWTVWRQDDNGNRYEVSRHDSRTEADSTAARMEARGHKQTYWVARSA
ncbi:hypothetical protein [Micromonospora narathiwatensis]|uniref:Uncharacterized protein n=1 Tax=Micromonospora narathiwatensis TaxID=299146 RepID=A0A1A9A1I2_9ACTN|nr:hypothetical protein [Micromonospora narathiwatensis]SBT50006.1 hypothetical protein GA0070621_3622 [Micromonospora narathiwatensis]